MMRTDAGFHADQARRHIGKAGLDLATRPFLTQHNRATLIVAHDVERVLADIDTNHGNCSVLCLGHGVLLVLTPLASLSLRGGARPDHPLPDMGDHQGYFIRPAPNAYRVQSLDSHTAAF